ncbi:MAG: sugar transferase [Acutalibacteraceae bacterium]|nr:sugar transferase [Acutalibacteraceae bacterium]HIR03208.1 sugar transferase [Candidatus Scatovicinus merdipullorum]
MYEKIKRIFEVILSCIGLLVLSPLLLATAVAVKVESEGPVIFKQKRIGKDGKVFEIYKFRSMCVGAERTGSGVYSGKNDARVTKVGRVLRATSIDELPQFVNILKGEMSFIGPRPVLTYHPWPYEEYTDWQKKRFLVRPGVTGWAQVNGRKGLPWEQRIAYDVEYVEHMSFWFDLRIFFKTIGKVFTNADNVNVSQTAPGSVAPATLQEESTEKERAVR